MNRTNDGRLLERADFIALALEAGMPASKVSTDTKTFVFIDASRRLRFEMWTRGELTLDTSEPFVPAPPPRVNWEAVEALTNGAVRAPA